MKIIIILQARMGSTRLPGKVLMQLTGKTVLEHILNRLNLVTNKSDLVVATTKDSRDHPIEEVSRRAGVYCVRGPEEDVLARYYFAAKELSADVIVRCNGDCPLIDPSVVDQVIATFLEYAPSFDYVSNILKPSFPTGLHCEVFTFAALKQAFEAAVDPLEREHVTPYIYRRPDVFRLHNVANEIDLSSYRWTLDYSEDFELIKKIYEALYPIDKTFGMREVLNLLQKNPQWEKINGHILKQSTV